MKAHKYWSIGALITMIGTFYVEIWQLDETTFVAGKGHRKSVQQRHYEKLKL